MTNKAEEYIEKRYHTLGFSKESTVEAVNLVLEDVEKLIDDFGLIFKYTECLSVKVIGERVVAVGEMFSCEEIIYFNNKIYRF